MKGAVVKIIVASGEVDQQWQLVLFSIQTVLGLFPDEILF